LAFQNAYILYLGGVLPTQLSYGHRRHLLFSNLPRCRYIINYERDIDCDSHRTEGRIGLHT